jgi:hypothetical protein
VIKIHKGIVRPESMPKLIPADDFSVVLQQKHKNLKRLLLELDSAALFAEFSCLRVYLKDAEAEQFRQMRG